MVKDVIVIGGGLAGLINSILLKRAGLKVLLFEEKKYPFHRVCGEYISNEVLPFLKNHELYPEELNPHPISKFFLTSVSGKNLKMPLDLGGFGISRYEFDAWLVAKALDQGVEIIHSRVIDVTYSDNEFNIIDKSDHEYQSRIVIGAYGKRSTLDKNLTRPFLTKRSPYVGVKYHLKTDHADPDEIALHNFDQGYCGISRVENDIFNLCYLTHRSNFKKNGSVLEVEENILGRNPYLKKIFQHSEILFDKPEVINEITFEKKEPVYNHILMSGDSAGMITPLCGNGMAMAIHSAKILSELIIKYMSNDFNRSRLEQDYTNEWNKHFSGRLWAGRKIQGLFGSSIISNSAVALGKTFRPFASYLMKQTHGTPF